jgi:hypothetical protein
MRPRRAVLLACLLAAVGTGEARAEPEPLSPEARRRAERAFFLGRLEDVEEILGASGAPVDREPLEVLHRFWRPGTRPSSDPVDGSLSSRRIRVLRSAASWPTDEYPVPAAGEVEPHPLLTALVLDRLRRESKGISGLPAESPLTAVRDELVDAFLDRAAFAYGRTEPGPDGSEARHAARVEELARRNARVAAAAGTAFLLLSLLLARRLGRVATATPPGPSTTPSGGPRT